MTKQVSIHPVGVTNFIANTVSVFMAPVPTGPLPDGTEATPPVPDDAITVGVQGESIDFYVPTQEAIWVHYKRKPGRPTGYDAKITVS